LNNAVNRVPELEPTLEDRTKLHQELNTTDLELTKTATADVPVAGQEIVYRFTVRNNGPRVARIVKLVDPLPPYLTLTTVTPPCAVDAGNTLTCELGVMQVGEKRDFEARLHIAVALPCKKDEQFFTLENRAHVFNVPGPDPNPRNNEAMTNTKTLCVRYEYAAKLICGKQMDSSYFALAHGQYATAVNIHNPNDEQTHFFKKIALTERGQKPGRVLPIAVDALQYDEALRLDCMDLRRRLPREYASESALEGFAVIQSPRSLDVTAVYTTSALRCTERRLSEKEASDKGKEPQRSASHTCTAESGPGALHVEQIRERRRHQPKQHKDEPLDCQAARERCD
jgi:uncharacterized repeat protein (TIGR01451 family)